MAKTMKRIHLKPEPKTILGRGFRIMDPESNEVSLTVTCPNCRQEFNTVEPAMIENANLIDLVKLLILGIPRQACTNQDSINAYDFMQQASESEDGILKVTDGIHDWLKKTIEKHGPAIYGVNISAILRALDNFDRAHESKEDEGKKIKEK